MAIDTLSIWRESFEDIYDKAMESLDDFKTGFYRNNGYFKLDENKKQQLLTSTLDEINNAVHQLSTLKYFNNYKDKELLFSEFLQAFMDYDLVETDLLSQSIILAGKKHFLSKRIRESELKNVKYSFTDFINNSFTTSVDELYSNEVISKADLEQIRKWQASNLVLIVETEKNCFIQKFKIECKQTLREDSVLQFYIDVLDKLFAFEHGITTNDFQNLLSPLSKLISFNDNLDEWEKAVYQFNFGNMNFDLVTPDNVSTILKFRSENNERLTISPPYFLVMALYKFQVWLERFQESKPIETDDEAKILDQAFAHALQKASIEAEQRQSIFENSFNREKIGAEDYKKLLQEEFKSLRLEANKLKHLIYYDNAENEDVLESAFKFHGYFKEDINSEADFLTKSLVLQDYISYIQWELDTVFEHKTLVYLKDTAEMNTAVLGSLIDKINLNKKKGKQFHDKLNRLYSIFEHSTLPVDFSFLDISEAFHDFFLECLDDLSNELDKLPQTERVLFIHSQLRNLRKKEALAGFENRQVDKYVGLLKEYLLIEADFLKETKELNYQIPAGEKPQKILLGASLHVDFKFILSDAAILGKIYTELNSHLQNGFINDDRTPKNLFINILTSRNVSNESGAIYFLCDTRQLRYIIDKMQHLFRALTFENIERTGKFISSRGNIVRANSLSKSKSASATAPKQVEVIDKIFSRLS